MSLTLCVAIETLRELVGGPQVCYTPLLPEGFDNTPQIDPAMPDYGPIYPDNPWSLNVHQQNAREMFDLIGLSLGDDCSGIICGPELIELEETCKHIVQSIRTVPDTNDPHIPSWHEHRFSKLHDLVVIARQMGGVISFC